MSPCSSSSRVTRSGGCGVMRARPRRSVVIFSNVPRLVRDSFFFSNCTCTWPRSAGSK